MKKTDFNSGWLFGHEGEEKKPVILPHDAMLHAGRSADSLTGSAGAFFNAGIYEYEKEIDVPADCGKKNLKLQFEGVMRNAKVYVNGIEAGGAAYGYIPFWVNLSEFIRPGEKNVIEVIADNSDQPASRWYSGGGIYRPVWLWEGGEAVIAPQGVRIRTLSYKEPEIEVEILTDGNAEGLTASLEISDTEGNIIAEGIVPIEENKGKTDISLPGAKLWDENEPNLYICRAVLKKDDEVVDEAVSTFGIRMVEKSKEGLLINGKVTLLRGGSVHHDHGVIGAVTTPESEFRRIRILKENGFNALRIAHNPACEELLRAADHYGMYIIDETWDMWYSHKSTKDYAGQFRDNYKEDVREMVERDYCHPSVIMYSIGNEVSEPAKPAGVELGKEIIDLIHRLDPSRPVTAGINIMIISQNAKGKGIYNEEGGRDDSAEAKTKGMNSTMFNLVASMVGTSMNKMGNNKKADAASSPILDALDVCGYNYGSGRYPLEAKAHPDRLVYGSEIFPQDVAKNWEMIKKYPHMCGDFLWTAWDYIGETGVGAWAYEPDGKGFDKPYPWKLGDTGALDILGDPNAEMFWAQAAWGVLDGCRAAVQPVNHPGVTPAKATWRGTNALPSWSWKGCEGNKAIVEVYTSGLSAELFLNDKSLGKRKVKGCKASFRAVYAPGTLKAVAYDAQGKVIGEDVLSSAKGDLHIEAKAAKEPVFEETDREVVYIEISVADENGTVEFNNDITLGIDVSGGELLGFGSACPRTEDDFVSGTYKTYYGRALAVIRKTKGEKAEIVIKGEGSEGKGFENRISV